MATGDATDIRARLRALLPAGWFPDAANSPILEAVLNGSATVLAGTYSLAQTAKAMTRIATSTGGFLDLASYDFFGYGLLRQSGETDAAYRIRIINEFKRTRNTRGAITQAMTDLTGRAPYLHEPWNPYDNGGYDVVGSYDQLSGSGVGPFGWGMDQTAMPAAICVTVFRPTDGRTFTDAMVPAMLEKIRPLGVTFWFQISN